MLYSCLRCFFLDLTQSAARSSNLQLRRARESLEAWQTRFYLLLGLKRSPRVRLQVPRIPEVRAALTPPSLPPISHSVTTMSARGTPGNGHGAISFPSNIICQLTTGIYSEMQSTRRAELKRTPHGRRRFLLFVERNFFSISSFPIKIAYGNVSNIGT